MVFAAASWVGTATENPTEKPLSLPAELQDIKLHPESGVPAPGAAAAPLADSAGSWAGH